MVSVPINVDGNTIGMYMDGFLHEQLTKKVYPSVYKKDFDSLHIVDGIEGAGKSVFAFQIAKVLDKNFNIDNVALSADQFKYKVRNSEKYRCIVFDEAFRGLSSRAALSEVNQALINLMMEMRQKNLFILLVMPSLFMLDKYAVLHRAKGLFHVKLRKGQRGFWDYYNKHKMKMLYFKGKKYYEYNVEKRFAFGKFRDIYTINESKYRKMKHDMFKDEKIGKYNKFKSQRDILISYLYKEHSLTQEKIVEVFKSGGETINRSTISKIITSFDLNQSNSDKNEAFEATVPKNSEL